MAQASASPARLSAPAGVRPEPRARARALSYLFLGGGTLGLGALVFFPVPTGTDVPGVLVAALISLVAGTVLFAGADQLPGWATTVGLALGTIVISLDIYFAGKIRTNDEMFYVLVAFYAFYFLPKRAAIAELALLGACYAAILALHHEADGFSRWVITVGSLAVSGLLTSRLVEQLESWAQRSGEREAALRQAEAQFRSAFEDAAIGMALVGLDGCWLRVNEALAQLTGYSTSKLVGMSFRDLTPEEDLQHDLQGLDDLVSGRTNAYHAEKRYRRADGEIVWVALSVSMVRDAHGTPVNMISQMQDITDRKAAERELVDRALHDPLTGLPNRLLFLDRVQVAISRIERTGAPVAVFFIDLDRFKLVNDSLGHAVGDRLLVEVAARLREALRPEDTVSRFGGDEFTVLAENVDERAATGVAERIGQGLAEPFQVDGHELFASASLGVSICREHQTKAEDMLRDSDAAMYRAKEKGQSHCVIFDRGMRSRATERLELETDLRRAIARDQLFLEYQPLVELHGGGIFGVEALVRWRHPRRGQLAPGEFIGVAEESELIVPLGEWVMREACAQLRAWTDAGYELSISINLSPRQLSDVALTDRVCEALEQTGVDPERVCLEITETAAVEVGVGRLEQLKALGVSLALDDFGTGFSSLNQIRRLPPVDTIKIDRSFIEELGRGATDTAIVGAILGMAAAMELAVIAEGIEHPEQVRTLIALGCERGQGFLFARPVSPDRIERLLGSPAVSQLAS